jgi:hypothetical protein
VVGNASLEEAMNEDAEWSTWKAWLGEAPEGDTIYAQVVEMMAFRQVWDSFAIIYKESPPEAKRFTTFALWVRWNYVRSQGLAIRRQTDPRSDVVSLARLIECVWRYPTVLSRERHRSRRSPDEFDLADRRFDEIAGPGADFIDPRIPAADFEELREETATVRKWVNTSVAHLTAKESPRETPRCRNFTRALT